MGTRRSAQDARWSSVRTPAKRTARRVGRDAACGTTFGEIFKDTEKYKRVEEKFERHVARASERQDEEDRKRRKFQQAKDGAARTGDASRSEPMEETHEKRPAEEEVERDNKRSPPGGPEAGQASGSTDE